MYCNEHACVKKIVVALLRVVPELKKRIHYITINLSEHNVYTVIQFLNAEGRRPMEITKMKAVLKWCNTFLQKRFDFSRNFICGFSKYEVLKFLNIEHQRGN